MSEMRESNNIIGENIRSIRIKAGLSQAQFGKSIRKSQSAVYSYENGTVVPEFDVLSEISQLYGVPVGHIIGIEWNPISTKTLRELYKMYLDEVKEYE